MSREHGTRSMYVAGKCRCELCKESQRAYESERRRRTEPAYVGADRTREHVKWLSEHGVRLKRIGEIAGVSQGCLWKLMYGDQKRFGRPTKRVRRSTEQAILAVMPEQGADGSRVPAGPTLAHIDELVARGWSRVAIARHVHGPQARSLQVNGATVTRGTAKTIEGLLDVEVEYRRDKYGQPIIPAVNTVEADPEPSAGRDADPLAVWRLPDDLDHDWRDEASCRRPEYPTYLFFPGRGDGVTEKLALSVCARCPVTEPCLQFALLTGSPGIWGGTTGRQRRNMRRVAA